MRAVEDAVRAGIVVVTSAGNYGINQDTGEVGYAGITSPGNAPSAITVGALDTHDTIDRADDVVAPYSSRGPAWYSGLAKPDLVAPGHRLVAVGAYRGLLYQQIIRNAGLGQGQEQEAAVSAPERHQHGRRSHERCRRADDPGEPRNARGAAHAERGQGDYRIHRAAGGVARSLDAGIRRPQRRRRRPARGSIDPSGPWIGEWWLDGPVSPSTSSPDRP